MTPSKGINGIVRTGSGSLLLARELILLIDVRFVFCTVNTLSLKSSTRGSELVSLPIFSNSKWCDCVHLCKRGCSAQLVSPQFTRQLLKPRHQPRPNLTSSESEGCFPKESQGGDSRRVPR